MMKTITTFAAIASIAALAACAPAPQGGGETSGAEVAKPATPSVQASPTDLSDFAGARAGQAEMGLQNRGYEAARTEGLTTYWYNSAENDCAKIVTDDGRYKSVDKVAPSECNAGGAAAAATPTAAEQACLRDVTKVTNNPDVTLLESSFSEAGTQVIVGVGPDRARWNCIAYNDGSTAGIESLTNEGSL